MKREIKFRAWHLDDGMLYFDFDSFQKDYHDQYGNIMQFTGLTDKNGKEIYEGDILKRRYYPLGSDRKIIEYYEIGVVVYGSPSFGLQLKFEGTNVLDEAKKLSHHRTEKQVHKHSSAGENWIDKFFYGEIEVIGNIYENPELL